MRTSGIVTESLAMWRSEFEPAELPPSKLMHLSGAFA
jgi:hypothetical protein